MSARGPVDLKGQLLLAALACSGGGVETTFTSEQLLVTAWKRDPLAWGLRGFETEYPDSDRIHREIDSRGKAATGLVQRGLIQRIQPRVYRLTPKGLVAASGLTPQDLPVREKANRFLDAEMQKILAHPSFKEWLQDPTRPKHFRDAGHFWSIAPGTPRKVVRERIQRVDDTLQAALSLFDKKGVEEVASGMGRRLFDRNDVERCLEFQEAMKQRFAGELELLGAG